MLDEPTDPYWRLRNPAPTPDDEICHCTAGTEVILGAGLTNNPLRCLVCNGEVRPERLGFDRRAAQEIAGWLSIYDALYRLWLDSGEYEAWATARLSDPHGQVNRWGREIVAWLNGINPAYYRWFVDVDTDGAELDPLSSCPVCSGQLATAPGKDFRVCSTCRILL